MADTQVLIAGAGPTGLVLALWLTKLGVRVRVIDRAAEPGTTSRALGVQARTLELYRQVGLDRAVIDAGLNVAGANLWVRGTRAARLPLGRMGQGATAYPFLLMFPQDEHERLLIDRLAALGVTVERPTELVRFTQDADGVRATLRGADGTEEACAAAYLAGCDGARSTVREAIGAGFPGGTYSRVFYVADVEASGPPVNREINVDLDEADLLVVFPMKGAGRVRLIGAVREERVAEHGKLTFDDVSGRAIEHLKLVVEKVNWFSTYRVHHRVAGKFRSGRAFLLGDAAHIHSPVGAQGMNTGIGDAVNLAWKLAAVLNGGGAAAILDTYEPERIAFARRLVATTDRIFTLVSSEGGLAKRVRTRLAPVVAPLLFKVRRVRRFLFRTVSQIGVRYRRSALSEGAAGGVRGGDRLPWVRLGADGADNFEPLMSLKWQVHVYGEPSDGAREMCERARVPLHVFAWEAGMGEAGLARGAAYLVRPDGYVAVAGGDAEGIGAYLERWYPSAG